MSMRQWWDYTVLVLVNLFVDYSLFGVNRNDVKLYDDIHWEVRPQDDWNVQAWGTEYTNQNMPVIWGSGGEATTKASITIFGDVPDGVLNQVDTLFRQILIPNELKDFL